MMMTTSPSRSSAAMAGAPTEASTSEPTNRRERKNVSKIGPGDRNLKSTRSKNEAAFSLRRRSPPKWKKESRRSGGGDPTMVSSSSSGSSSQPDGNRMRHFSSDDFDELDSSGIESDPVTRPRVVMPIEEVEKNDQKLRKCILELEWFRARLSDRDLEVEILEKRLASTQAEPRTLTLPGISRSSSSSSSAHWRECRHCTEKDDVIAELYDLLASRASDETGKSANTMDDEEAFITSAGQIDFDLIGRHVGDLNRLVGENEKTIEYNAETHTGSFQRCPALSLDLYANGFYLDGQVRFRFFNEAASQAFLKDLTDGFFPAELQGEYPDGVTLLLMDRRGETGPGSRLGRTQAFGGMGGKLEESEPTSGLHESISVPNFRQTQWGLKSEQQQRHLKSSNSGLRQTLAPLEKCPSVGSLTSSRRKKSALSQLNESKGSSAGTSSLRGGNESKARATSKLTSGSGTQRPLRPLAQGETTGRTRFRGDRGSLPGARKLPSELLSPSKSSPDWAKKPDFPPRKTQKSPSSVVVAPFQSQRKPPRNSCQLKVIGLAGVPLILELVAYDTVKTLAGILGNQWQLLGQEEEQHQAPARVCELQMFSSFPRQRVDRDETMTLGDLGLLPRSVLHVVVKSRPSMQGCYPSR